MTRAMIFGKSKTYKDLYSTEMEVFKIGTYNGDKYKKKDLFAMVEAFNTLKDKWKPTLKIGHGKQLSEQPALGYVDKLKVVGIVLVAKIKDIPKIVKEAMEKGLYKKRSAEIYWNYKDQNKIWPRCLKAIALLGESIPAVTSLKDIEKFFDEGEGDIKNYELDIEEVEEVEEVEAGDYAIDHKGKNNPNWKDGSAPGYYRRYLDKHTICEKCKKNKATMVHHKDGNRSNNINKNLMAVCRSCHMVLENGNWKKHSEDKDNKEVKGYMYWSEDKDKIKARVKSMDLFDFETLEGSGFKDKKGVTLITGVLSEAPEDKGIIQGWTFDRSLWTREEAQTWLQGYGYGGYPETVYGENTEEKIEDGIKFPKEAYLYTPDESKSSTWNLRIWENLKDKVTETQLEQVVAAFSSEEFKIQLVQMSTEDVNKIKSNLKSLYKELGVKGVKEIKEFEIPKHPRNKRNKEVKIMDWEAKVKEMQEIINGLNTKITEYQDQEKTKEVIELKEQLTLKETELTEMKAFKEEADKFKIDRDKAIEERDASNAKVQAVEDARRTDSITNFVKDNGVNGTKKILPRDEKLVIDILSACPQKKEYKLEDKDVSLEDMVKKYIEGFSKVVDTKQHSHKDGEGEYDTATKELEGKIAEYREKDVKVTYTEAFEAVLKADSDLKDRYHKERA